jgi:hypothetical protein
MQITVTFPGRRGEKTTAEACIVGRSTPRKKRCAWAVSSTKKSAARAALVAISHKL